MTRLDPKLNQAHMDKITDLVNRGHFCGLLGIKINELDAGLCRAEMEVLEKHMNPFMNIHGGAYAGLMDHITFWCLYGALPENMGYTTIDLHIDDLRACKDGLLTAEARLLKKGSTICLVEADITDAKGRLMAHAVSKLFCSPTLQGVQDMIDDVEPGLVLPPKFLEE